jgi:hypothetical protein
LLKQLLLLETMSRMVPLLFLCYMALSAPIDAKVPSSDDPQREDAGFVSRREQPSPTPLTYDTQRRFFRKMLHLPRHSRRAGYLLSWETAMPTGAREYIDFWIENSVHAVEQFGMLGASQDVAELVRRLIEGAKGQGFSEAVMRQEVGDLTEYLRSKLATANQIEKDRQK